MRGCGPPCSPVMVPNDALAVGFAVFQVFTVDYIEAEGRKAKVWNSGPPASIADAIPLIWPHRLRANDVAWPSPAFPNDTFDGWPIGTWHCVAQPLYPIQLNAAKVAQQPGPGPGVKIVPSMLAALTEERGGLDSPDSPDSAKVTVQRG